MVRPDSEGNVHVPIYNCAPVEVKVAQNEFLGHAENVSKCEKRQLNPSYLNSINANGAKVKTTLPNLIAEKEEFIQKTAERAG